MSPIARNCFRLCDSYILLQSRYELNLEHNQLCAFLVNSTNLFTGHSNTNISLLFEEFFRITSWTLCTKPSLSLNIFNICVIYHEFWIVFCLVPKQCLQPESSFLPDSTSDELAVLHKLLFSILSTPHHTDVDMSPFLWQDRSSSEKSLVVASPPYSS